MAVVFEPSPGVCKTGNIGEFTNWVVLLPAGVCIVGRVGDCIVSWVPNDLGLLGCSSSDSMASRNFVNVVGRTGDARKSISRQ